MRSPGLRHAGPEALEHTPPVCTEQTGTQVRGTVLVASLLACLPRHRDRAALFHLSPAMVLIRRRES